ncbi:cytochrome c oxidase assembly protein [Planococcus dechangensis]|uniref:Cytochrome c oxidase assembly protein n=1 Tax=Planococcus dechangensis TaxID=1176255 RepID=A0ABV9MC26_9BACL
MTHHHAVQIDPWFSAIAFLALASALLVYPLLAVWSSRRYRKWPLHRYVFWSVGVITGGAAVVGPLAQLSHSNFTAHMVGHLLLGMLAPLLILYGKPVALLLRSVPRNWALTMSRFLHSPFVSFVGHPMTAALLNVGGLYILYRTNVFIWMHQSIVVYALIHLHISFAAYLFTMSILYVDVTARRYSFLFRALVLIGAFAGHKILAKSLYVVPPAGVDAHDAQKAALIMYYGGDMIDLAIIILLFFGWYKATAPGRISRAA